MIYLFATVCVLLTFLGWTQWLHARQVKTLVNVVIARTPGEARMLNAPDAPRPKPAVFTDEEREFMDGFAGPVGL